MNQGNSRINQALKQGNAGLNAGKGAQPMRQPAPMPRQGNAPQDMAAPQGNGDFDALVEELTALIQQGRMPEGFDLMTACQDPAFLDLMEQFPAEAAVRVYMAEKKAAEAEENAMSRVNAQVRSRNGLPRSQRGAAMSAPAPDYRNMDSDAFKGLLYNVKKSARNGGNPRL